MSKFDWSDLDARLLQLLVAVVEVGSITGAAQRLGVTQSAVSHLLDKLRAITGDPLFVKSGRGIVATARAEALAAQARELLGALERFARSASSTRRAGRPPSPLPPTTSSATCCCPP
jgi:DNA-binding transcriptional LysR family regulator